MVQNSEPRSVVPGRHEPFADDASDHLADVPDGCGCVEVWERLGSHRA